VVIATKDGEVRSLGTIPNRPSRLAHCLADDRRDAAGPSLVLTSDGPAPRIGMKLRLVMFPAERTAKSGYCYPCEGDEVLKCFD
jgi:hypothetical protein